MSCSAHFIERALEDVTGSTSRNPGMLRVWSICGVIRHTHTLCVSTNHPGQEFSAINPSALLYNGTTDAVQWGYLEVVRLDVAGEVGHMEHAGRRRAAALGRLLTKKKNTTKKKRRAGKKERTANETTTAANTISQSREKYFTTLVRNQCKAIQNTAANTTSQSREKTFTTLRKAHT